MTEYTNADPTSSATQVVNSSRTEFATRTKIEPPTGPPQNVRDAPRVASHDARRRQCPIRSGLSCRTTWALECDSLEPTRNDAKGHAHWAFVDADRSDESVVAAVGFE